LRLWKRADGGTTPRLMAQSRRAQARLECGNPQHVQGVEACRGSRCQLREYAAAASAKLTFLVEREPARVGGIAGASCGGASPVARDLM